MQPLISILIPVFNGARYLPTCLNSVLAQTYQPVEIVLINDGSTDNTAEICKAYAKKDGRIRYFEQPNQGLSATRNIGVRHARGDLVSFVDADDDVAPTYLSYLWSLLQSSHCKISACNHWICREPKQKTRFPVEESHIILTPQSAFANILYDRCPDVSAWGKLYQKDVLEAILYPQSRVFEDTFRIAEILLAGGGLVYGGQPQYYYRIQSDSLSRGTFNKRKLDYIAAVDHMTEVMAAHCAGLENGISRRKMHALLSVRRYMVGCSAVDLQLREDLERRIREGALKVLRDAQAPCRDKISILSILIGAGAYDTLWKAYEKLRRL